MALVAAWFLLTYAWLASLRGSLGFEWHGGDTQLLLVFEQGKLWAHYWQEEGAEHESYWDLNIWPARRATGISFFDGRPDLSHTQFAFRHTTPEHLWAEVPQEDRVGLEEMMAMRFRVLELVLPCWLLWTPLSLALMPIVVRSHRQQRSRRRLATGQCISCGYDLHATPERCPECGHVAHDYVLVHATGAPAVRSRPYLASDET